MDKSIKYTKSYYTKYEEDAIFKAKLHTLDRYF